MRDFKRFKAIPAAIAVLLALFFFSGSSLAAEYRIGGGARWLTSGGGFAEKGFVRISLTNNGTLTLRSTMENGVERITGYNMQGILEATGFHIDAWEQSDDHNYPIPIEVRNFNPSMSDPFNLPPITIDKLTYTVSFTGVNSGTISLRGYIDIDTVGECEVNADNAMWRSGTERPSVPETESGCDSGAGPLSLVACFFIRKMSVRFRKPK
ncbi:MAG: hypothetical protein LBI74_02700 [Synergistaceae bacterium]|jgi:hypothetical protein|nr:hypothetical protein [Synergistaceae bacterium]